MSNPAVDAVERTDPWLTRAGLHPIAQSWAGDLALDDPRVSPLFGVLTDLPPVEVWVGTRDITLPDCRELERRMPVGAAFALHVEDGAIHDYPLLPTPEGRAASREMADSGCGAGRCCRVGSRASRMITVEEYLTYCDKALDGYAAIARQLGDDLVNERPADVPGANTASGLIAHAAGVISRWGSTVNLGIVVPRDRDAEFAAIGTVGRRARTAGCRARPPPRRRAGSVAAASSREPAAAGGPPGLRRHPGGRPAARLRRAGAAPRAARGHP